MGICKTCGKIFYSKNLKKEHCSKNCRKIAAEIKRRENEQPCWNCGNACGGCSWAQDFTPVKDWEAEPVTVKDKEGDIRTYKIKYCPQYTLEKHGGYYGKIY